MLSSASSSKKKLWDTKPEFCLQKIHFKCMCARPPVVVITNLDDLHRFPVQHRFVIHVDSRSCSVLGGGRPEEMARNCPSSTGERFWSERCDNVKRLNLFSLYSLFLYLVSIKSIIQFNNVCRHKVNGHIKIIFSKEVWPHEFDISSPGSVERYHLIIV